MMEPQKSDALAIGRKTERRIEILTIGIGVAAAVIVALVRSRREGAGILIGALLAWVNFRWLQEALDALRRLSTAQAGAETPRVLVWTWVRFLGRYALIGLAVYVIFIGFKVPVLSMILGLCALGAAAMAASLYEVVRPVE